MFIPGFDEIAAQQIMPRHVWSAVADPVAFANENPVATGPFTEVRVFQNQVYELGRNPHYWRPGEPHFEAIRCPAYPSNDRANLALVFDEADWAGNFIPAVDRVYVGRNPEHHRYWFPLTGSSIFLYANTTRAPFDDARVRRALSLAIDRDLVVDVALYRYSRPADATGEWSLGVIRWVRMLDARQAELGIEPVLQCPEGGDVAGGTEAPHPVRGGKVRQLAPLQGHGDKARYHGALAGRGKKFDDLQ